MELTGANQVCPFSGPTGRYPMQRPGGPHTSLTLRAEAVLNKNCAPCWADWHVSAQSVAELATSLNIPTRNPSAQTARPVASISPLPPRSLCSHTGAVVNLASVLGWRGLRLRFTALASAVVAPINAANLL